MERQRTIMNFCIIAAVLLAMPAGSGADAQWHYQASVQVPQPGLVETVLPAGLFFSTDDSRKPSQVDVTLIGPDGNPRSFELYWKEDTGPRSVALRSTPALIERTRTLLWEAAAPADLLIEKIRIDIDATETMGSVKIEGKDAQGWHVLAGSAALYASGGRSGTEIEIKPMAYERMRLSFRGYDRKFRETTLPVTSVTLSGKNRAKDYAEKTVDLRFTDKVDGKVRVISSILPGAGLWVEKLSLSTEAQFQGTWELGAEVVAGGKVEFQKLLSGSIASVGKKGSLLEIPVKGYWLTRSFVLRIDTAEKYVGSVKALGVTVNVPRMAFYADRAGIYLAQAGRGNSAAIQQSPGEKDRKIGAVLSFSEVSENSQWVPERLAEKYAIAGGPFDQKGFSWRTPLRIPEAGYYRLVLNRETSLTANPEKLRLVRDGAQIPYFLGPSEAGTIDLTAKADYDKAKNRTTWTVDLPERSVNISELSAESEGVFERTAVLEVPKPGRSGWQMWRSYRWQNTAPAATIMRLPITDLPRDVRQVRISMDHGDNRPIELRRLQAAYHAPVLLFLASQPGEYALFGGNEAIPAARYDLALVQAHLAGAMPKTLLMGGIEPVRYAGFKHAFLGLFEDRSWGLYLVLGLVTLVLMVLIVRLFPKEEKG